MSAADQKLSLIDDNFTTCEICAMSYSASSTNGSLKIPKTLDCLHIFCKQCLVKSMKPGATQIECFICRATTSIDVSLGVDSLKTNFMLQNLVATLHPSPNIDAVAHKTSSSTTTTTSITANGVGGGGDTVFKLGGVTTAAAIATGGEGLELDDENICSYCPDGVATQCTMFCTQCEDAFCGSCSETHLIPKRFKGHQFIELSSAKKKVNRKCSIHKKEDVKFVCETCSPHMLCCTICMVDDGHQKRGHEMSSIEKYGSKRKNEALLAVSEAKKLLDAQKDIQATVERRIQVHRENLASSRIRINNSFERFIEILSDAKKAWLDDLEIEGSAIERILSADKKTVQIHVSNAGLFIDQAETILTSLSDIEFIEQSNKVKESLSNANEVLVAPFTLTNIVSAEGFDKAESESIASLTRQFQVNPFRLPGSQKVRVGGRIKEIQFPFSSVGDKNGLLYYLGTQGRTDDYSNPHASKAVFASASRVGSGSVDAITGRSHQIFYTCGAAGSWIKVDLGIGTLLTPTYYSFKHGYSSNNYYMRNWRFQGSVDGDNWITLREHIDDDSINDGGYCPVSWPIENSSLSARALSYRFFRVLSTGPNAGGGDDHAVVLCCLELYGTCSFEVSETQTASSFHAAVTAPSVIPSGGSGSLEVTSAQRILSFASTGDTNGVLYFIGTQGGTAPYANPHSNGSVTVSASSVSCGNIDMVIGRDHQIFYTHMTPGSWIKLDLGRGRLLTPNYYTIKHAYSSREYSMRNWRIEGSADNINWVSLRDHVNDATMNSAYAPGSWSITNNGAYRYFRIVSTGPNAGGVSGGSSDHAVVLYSLELYGLFSWDSTLRIDAATNER